jgi:hypothetical protein
VPAGTSGVLPTGLPVGHSSSIMNSPSQKDPYAIHGVPSASSTMPGSIALYGVVPSERHTSPWSTQR